MTTSLLHQEMRRTYAAQHECSWVRSLRKMNLMNTKTIYKYPLAISDGQAVLMPVSAEILSVQFQGEDLCIWAEVNPTEQKHARVIHIFGTGQPNINTEGMNYLGTVQQFNGKLVWHVFEKTP